MTTKNKYPLIERLRLEVCTYATGGDYVYAEDLENLLADSPIVYNKYEDDHMWTTFKYSCDIFSALIVGVQPIENKSKEESQEDLNLKIKSLEERIKFLERYLGPTP